MERSYAAFKEWCIDMKQTDNYVQIMTDSLRMKRSVLEKIVSLNEEQKNIITSDVFDGDAFSGNVGKKAELVDEINKLDAGFDDLFKRVREVLDIDKESYVQEIAVMKSLIRSVTELCVKIEAEEARNKKLVEKKFAELRRNVKAVQDNMNKANIYYQNMNKLDMTPQFMDQKK